MQQFKVDEKVIEKLNSWFAQKGIDPHCIACGHGSLSAVDHLVATIGWNQGSFLSGISTMPMIALVCDNCGYTHMYSAAKIGLVRFATTPSAPGGADNLSESQLKDS